MLNFFAEDLIQGMICENIFIASPAGNQGPITGRNEILLHKFKECQIGWRKKSETISSIIGVVQ